jgi:hypothetical protein
MGESSSSRLSISGMDFVSEGHQKTRDFFGICVYAKARDFGAFFEVRALKYHTNRRFLKS